MRGNLLSLFIADLLHRLPQRRYLDREDRLRRLLRPGLLPPHLNLGACLSSLARPHCLENREIASLLFLAAESLSFLLLCLMASDVWHLRGHRPEGLNPTASGRWTSLFLAPGSPSKSSNHPASRQTHSL